MVDWPDPSDLFNLLVDMFNWLYEQQWHYLQCSSSSQYTPENSDKKFNETITNRTKMYPFTDHQCSVTKYGKGVVDIIILLALDM